MGEHAFDKEYWEQRWQDDSADSPGSMTTNPPNPHLVREVEQLVPGTALDAGCGSGAEAIWLAMSGWQVTAADISSDALARAAERAASRGAPERLQWVQADLRVWNPSTPFDLVTTHYAHPDMPQLDFYERIASWVAPGGTLLIVGHLHTHGAEDHGHDHHPPAEASATAATISERLDPSEWQIITADELHRTMSGSAGREIPVHDVVVRAIRGGTP